MGKINAMALDNQSIIENEWYEEQYALLRSQGYEHDEVEEIIEEMINEYQQEVALDNADIMELPNEN
tara:strand:- start:418 stop:618 length:201 start_codon:yes stop_codon:yes gene_type:complete